MKKEHSFLERIADRADLSGEPIPGCPLVEIAGDHRVLVENHFGICGYCGEQISVKVKFGIIRVGGSGLELVRMTKEQLIISGRIHQISLERREM